MFGRFVNLLNTRYDVDDYDDDDDDNDEEY